MEIRTAPSAEEDPVIQAKSLENLHEPYIERLSPKLFPQSRSNFEYQESCFKKEEEKVEERILFIFSNVYILKQFPGNSKMSPERKII